MSQTVSTRALLRVTVLSEGRRLDIGIPGSLPLVELMPGFARSLGVLEPTMTHAGYALQRADGTELDPSLGAASQGVADGELLTLARGGLLAQPRVYDDVVEAVLDATSEQQRPWTALDNARTALAASLTLLGVCLVLLLAAGPSVVGAAIAGGGAVVLVAVSAVTARLGQSEAGQGLGFAAAAFAAVAGYLAVPVGPSLWSWPLAAAGLGAAVVGIVVFFLTPASPQYQLVSVIAGATVGLTALVGGLLPAVLVGAWAIMVAVVATLGNGMPWLALGSTRIRVISPQSDAEVFAAPAPIDADQVKRRAAAGHRVLFALRVAVGIAVLAATPLVAASGAAGAILCALAFLGMMFPSRQAYARRAAMALMVIGAGGLAVTGTTVALAQPGLRTATLVTVLAATAVVVTITLLAPGVRLRLARLADTAEIAVIAALLPFGVIAAGWA